MGSSEEGRGERDRCLVNQSADEPLLSVVTSVKVAPTYLELIALICAYSVLIFDAIKISTE